MSVSGTLDFVWGMSSIVRHTTSRLEFITNLMHNFDVLTSTVSFIWAPSTRGGVAYGVKLTLY
jgi:pectin methylesterase-like acyl-CoA thioesterase